MIRALLLMLYCSVAIAAPRAGTPQECSIYSDVAIVARALAIEHIKREQRARLYGMIYEAVLIITPSERLPEVSETIGAIDKAAAAAHESALDFSRRLLAVCNRTRGDMDSVLEDIGT
jgi:hypothetical protein